jgi:hypothetical protein
MLEVATKPALQRHTVRTLLDRVPGPRLSPIRQALAFANEQSKWTQTTGPAG